MQPLPDPGQDDGRQISSLVLSKIAEAVTEEYAPSQIPTFLQESGIPTDRFIGDGGLRDDVHAVLMSVAEWDSEGRRILRRFIGQWLSDKLTSGPTDNQRATITTMLARRGWHVRDGNLVIGEYAAESQTKPAHHPEQATPLGIG